MAEFYRIVRVLPNGKESIFRDILIASVSEEQAVRAAAFADGSVSVPSGQHIRVYSSQEDGTVTPRDIIWDSKVNL